MTQAIHPEASAAFHGPSLPSVPYATAIPPWTGPRAWAGAAILAAGVALVGLGGCFLIGVLGIVNPTALNGTPGLSAPLTGPQTGFLVVLYILAFACFAGAAALLFVGARGLLRVVHG